MLTPIHVICNGDTKVFCRLNIQEENQKSGNVMKQPYVFLLLWYKIWGQKVLPFCQIYSLISYFWFSSWRSCFSYSTRCWAFDRMVGVSLTTCYQKIQKLSRGFQFCETSRMRIFADMKPSLNGEVTPPFTDVGQSCTYKYQSWFF